MLTKFSYSKFILIFICGILISNFAKSQNGYHVIYYTARVVAQIPDTSFYHLVINDSSAYFFTTEYQLYDQRYPENTTEFCGDKSRHHEYLYDRKNSIFYHIRQRSLSSKRKKLEKIKLNTYPYVSLKDTVLQNGMLCNYGILRHSLLGAVFVTYSKEIQLPFGPWGYFGLPGLIVDYDVRTKVRHYKLHSIQRGNYKILFPEQKFKRSK